MPSRVIPVIHQLPPLIKTILADLYGQFHFVNSVYFPLAATSTVQHIPVTVEGVLQSETVCKWYKDDDTRPLRATLAFHCEDTVLFADIFMHQSEGTVRVKLRCVTDIDRFGCNETKAVALVSTNSEWQRMVDKSVRPLVAFAIERDRALGLHFQQH